MDKQRLSADETRLLLAAKGHKIKGVRSDAELGSMEYIQAVCNLRCGIDNNASIYIPYFNLARKLLSANDFAILFDNMYKRMSNPFIKEPKIDQKLLTETLIIGLQCRKVVDLELDNSLV